MKSQAISLSDLSVRAVTGTQTASRTLPNWNRNVTSGPSIITGTLPTPTPLPLALPTLLPLEVVWFRCATVAPLFVLSCEPIKSHFSASSTLIPRASFPLLSPLVIPNAKDDRKFYVLAKLWIWFGGLRPPFGHDPAEIWNRYSSTPAAVHESNLQ